MSQALPADDDEVPDGTLLYRWVPREKIVRDNELGRHRPSSDCFRNTTGTDEMSVHLGDTLDAQGRDPSELIEDLRSVGSLPADFVRNQCAKEIRRTPLRGDQEELAHGSVLGKENRKAMARMAQASSCIEHEGDWERAKLGP
jgi:hypothetical protein